MTIKEMRRFCAKHGQHDFLREPFRIAGAKNNLVIASDGYSLLAVEVFNNSVPSTLALVNGSNAEKINEWISVDIPETKYCIEDLDKFLGPETDREEADPFLFDGHRIDRIRMRTLFTLADEPYQYVISNNAHGQHSFVFKFSRYTAVIMGMTGDSSADVRYTPKVIK